VSPWGGVVPTNPKVRGHRQKRTVHSEGSKNKKSTLSKETKFPRQKRRRGRGRIKKQGKREISTGGNEIGGEEKPAHAFVEKGHANQLGTESRKNPICN